MPALPAQASDETTKVAETTLDDVLTQSDAIVEEKSNELCARKEQRRAEYYRDVKEALAELDPETDWSDWTNEEIRVYLKEARRFSYSLDRILEERGQSSQDVTEDLIYMEDGYGYELCDVLADVVADGFSQNVDVPLGYYIDRYHLDDREFLADLAERAYAMQDTADGDEETLGIAGRVFSALMRDDVSDVGRTWVGRHGRKHLREWRHLGGY